VAGDPAAKKLVTPEEYLTAERSATDKHFLWDGQVYVLVTTNRRHVDHFRRQADESWVLRSFDGSAVVPLDTIGCALALGDAYDRTNP
jgi:hypothetical protein